MNDIGFFKNFNFSELKFHGVKHTDNSHGISTHYIGYMKRGGGVLTASDRVLELCAGDLFYIPKGLKYRSCWKGENDGEGEVVFDSIGFLYFPTETADGYALQKVEYDDATFSAYRPLSVSKDVNLESIGVLCHFLGLIEPRLEKSKTYKAADTVQRILMLMEEDHTKTISEYAQICNISESLLYLYFKEYGSESPNEARCRIACEKAENLLKTSDLSVEAICDKLDFSSSSYFRKILYKKTGKTPSAIRKSASSL